MLGRIMVMVVMVAGWSSASSAAGCIRDSRRVHPVGALDSQLGLGGHLGGLILRHYCSSGRLGQVLNCSAHVSTFHNFFSSLL